MRSLPPWHVLCFGCLQVGLTLVSVVAKLAYSYDLGAWGFLEGMMSARNHPNILFWNITRFNPFYCMLEVGAIAGSRSAGTLDDSTVVVSAHICSGSSMPPAVLRSQLLSPQTLSDRILVTSQRSALGPNVEAYTACSRVARGLGWPKKLLTGPDACLAAVFILCRC